MGRQSRSLCRLLVVVSGVAILGAVSTAAPAAASGVVVDPGSPAGKEYAIPLAQARGQGTRPGTPGANDQPSGGQSGGLFGQGIRSPSSVAQRRARAAQGRGSAPDAAHSKVLTAAARQRRAFSHSPGFTPGLTSVAPHGAVLPAGVRRSSAGGIGAGWLVPLAVVIIAAGIVAGLTARRLGRRATSPR